MATTVPLQTDDRSLLMRNFLKRIVENDKRSKQIFRLYFDRQEISEEQFYKAISG
ncbi:MAG: hypothetical protein AB8B92_05445 [Gammaproteobacteria bacterium]